MLAAPLLCALCGAGPFLNDRALRTHNVRKHHFVIPFKAKTVRIAFVSLQAKVQHKGMFIKDLVDGLCGIMVMLEQLQDNV